MCIVTVGSKFRCELMSVYLCICLALIINPDEVVVIIIIVIIIILDGYC